MTYVKKCDQLLPPLQFSQLKSELRRTLISANKNSNLAFMKKIHLERGFNDNF